MLAPSNILSPWCLSPEEMCRQPAAVADTWLLIMLWSQSLYTGENEFPPLLMRLLEQLVLSRKECGWKSLWVRQYNVGRLVSAWAMRSHMHSLKGVTDYKRLDQVMEKCCLKAQIKFVHISVTEKTSILLLVSERRKGNLSHDSQEQKNVYACRMSGFRNT
uniref:Uncharacterized protein n=1 Tax=Pavo cristatus TaxID=9049 RepID=A0A8C9FGN6_PAVCR